jgi:GntR family transcriptional regulator / MocR family aminotransferase
LVLQLWLAELLNTGTVDQHLRRMRVHYRKKRNLIADYLRQKFPDWRWQLPSGGLQFWIQLPPKQDAEQVVQPWLACGMKIFSGSEYCGNSLDESNDHNHLILGFGAATEAQIHQAFSQLD